MELVAKLYMSICPKCNHFAIYKNRIDWILHTPFHWFGKRRFKCDNCGKKSYVKLTKVKKVGKWK